MNIEDQELQLGLNNMTILNAAVASGVEIEIIDAGRKRFKLKHGRKSYTVRRFILHSYNAKIIGDGGVLSVFQFVSSEQEM